MKPGTSNGVLGDVLARYIRTLCCVMFSVSMHVSQVTMARRAATVLRLLAFDLSSLDEGELIEQHTSWTLLFILLSHIQSTPQTNLQFIVTPNNFE